MDVQKNNEIDQLSGAARRATDPAHAQIFTHLESIAEQLGALPAGDLAGIRRVMAGLAIDARPVGGTTLVPVQSGTLRGTWIVPQNADTRRRVLFCHGGSFAFGDVGLYGGLLSRLALRAEASVFFVDFRLAPEHSYPAAHEDCIDALRYVAAEGPNGVKAADKIATAGDSSGANLAIAAALAGIQVGVEVWGTAVFSPFVDLSVRGESWTVNRGRDPLLSEAAARGCAAGYAPSLVATDPRLSALFADLAPLPRLHIQGSVADPLRDDAVRLAERAHASGVTTTLHLWAGLPHAWYLFAGELPTAARGLALAADFLNPG